MKDPRHGLDFFRRFDLVLSGLDNLEARRHVNRLCLAAGVPLVESGTAGYLGQVGLGVPGLLRGFCFQVRLAAGVPLVESGTAGYPGQVGSACVRAGFSWPVLLSLVIWVFVDVICAV